MVNKKDKIGIIIEGILIPSVGIFIFSFLTNREISQAAPVITFYLFFLIVAFELFFSFFISCCLRFKIFGKPITSYNTTMFSFLLIISSDFIFLWCFLKFTTNTSLYLTYTEIFQHWRRFWVDLFLLRWFFLNYPMHKKILKLN